jgi:hypothetical protein
LVVRGKLSAGSCPVGVRAGMFSTNPSLSQL